MHTCWRGRPPARSSPPTEYQKRRPRKQAQPPATLGRANRSRSDDGEQPRPTDKPEEPAFHTVKETAPYLRLCEKQVRRLIWRGELAAYRFGTALRIKKEDIDAYAELRTNSCWLRKQHHMEILLFILQIRKIYRRTYSLYKNEVS